MTIVLKSHSEWLKSQSEASAKSPSVVCLGNFDGFHLGHQTILRNTLIEARNKRSAKQKSVIFTFWPHPRRFFQPEKGEPKLLMSREEKLLFFRQLGFDFVVMQEFDEEFSRISAQDFIDRILIEKMHAEMVVVGRGFHFGYQAKGNPDLLRSSGKFSVLECRDERAVIGSQEISVSSSAIRSLVEAGNIQDANICLGYDYFLSGKVSSGDARGVQLGARTANIEGERECLPKPGVYLTMLEDIATGKYFASISNLGFAPTFSRDLFRVEAHLLGFEGDLYNRTVRLFFLERVRDEMKFADSAKLRFQIDSDIQFALKFFADQKLLRSDLKQISLTLESPAAESQTYRGLDFIRDLS